MKGSCLCGAVRYQVVKFDTDVANCYCTMCQKSSGSAFATYGSVRPADFAWLTGEEHVKVYQSSATAERGFCEICGSSLYFKLRTPHSGYEVSFGTLDEAPNEVPNANIYCASKAKWSVPTKNLPDYKEGRIER